MVARFFVLATVFVMTMTKGCLLGIFFWGLLTHSGSVGHKVLGQRVIVDVHEYRRHPLNL